MNESQTTKKSHLLLLEDEAVLAETLMIALRQLGFEVTWSTTIESAKNETLLRPFHMAIIDRNLPDGDGLDFCKHLRKSGYSTMGVLLLTAEGQLNSRIEGLEAGADDYLAKPFSWKELQARILAISRRSHSSSQIISNVAPSTFTPNLAPPQDWTCDSRENKIYVNEKWINLTALEYKLANTLISNAKKTLKRSELLKTVWGFSLLPQTRTVDYFMVRLRKHFELDPENPKHFITMRGVGYRFDP